MPELRKDPIVSRWVIISTERGKRPMDLRASETPQPKGPEEFCPFCEGNESSTPPEILAYRPSGSKPNEGGWSLRVTPNKFPALMIEGGLDRHGDGVYDMMSGIGAHEVIIETPDHASDLADMPLTRFEDVLWAYRERTIDLKKDGRLRYILIFKNHGFRAGASLAHSHSQLIALPIVPKTVMEELEGAKAYYHYKERCLYCDIVSQEIDDQKRVVAENEDFLAICPFAPRFPFEMWVMPKKHIAHYEDIDRDEAKNLAQLLQRVLRKLSKALDDPSYNFLIHTTPVEMKDAPHYHWHIEITPRITRLAGFERGSGFYINPTAPEVSAQYLREIDVP